MQQTTETTVATYKERIARLQAVMRTSGYQAVVLEPGPAMVYLTGVRWGKSERTFAVVLPAQGEPVWVLPGFEEARARELIQVGPDIRVWQEDESPYERIVQGIKDRAPAAPAGPARVGIDDSARFFVFDASPNLRPNWDSPGPPPSLSQAGATPPFPPAAAAVPPAATT